MNEIIKQTFTAIPQYVVNFCKLLSSPRQFPLDKLPKDESNVKESLAKALKFVLISYALILILNALKIDSGNEVRELGSVAVLTLIQMCLLVFPVFLGWRVFGSKKQFLDYLIIYSYHFGVVFIIIALITLISNGYLKTFDKKLYEDILKVKSNPSSFKQEWISNLNVQIAFGILIFGLLLTSIWMFIGWGSYRILNNTKKWRSLGVLWVTGIFSWIAFGISFLLANALK